MEETKHIEAITTKLAAKIAKSLNRFWNDTDATRLRKRAEYMINDWIGEKCETELTLLRMQRFIFAELKRIDADAYHRIFPEYRMDRNGEYTQDRSQWV